MLLSGVLRLRVPLLQKVWIASIDLDTSGDDITLRVPSNLCATVRAEMQV